MGSPSPQQRIFLSLKFTSLYCLILLPIASIVFQQRNGHPFATFIGFARTE